MLITVSEVQAVLNKYNIVIEGVLHIGAHDCEELSVYETMGIPKSNVVWIDAIESKVSEATKRGIPNVYHAVVSDTDNEQVTFQRTNNDQSSSILSLGTHATNYPDITVISQTPMTAITVDTFLASQELNVSKLHLWNFDIQGAELKALKGGVRSLKHVLYLEINTEEVYKNCGQLPELDKFLELQGFERVITKMTREGWGDALYIRKTRVAIFTM
jgi:FkbM family methyltransferase